ncbi:Ger(x)C family spore germination protein [Neobacillus cucumis]|uniref:Ger(x)C family spore germination protein n=1 Tax=Neobacillus cucumis TaxID=1740721 RepID=UPI0018E03692|nr:Ger(x)C family spore germination protein [Neobacillus cucumis]MBI0575864.1 Ger(x)C family spore germination protein [Neobacillus cucumis]
MREKWMVAILSACLLLSGCTGLKDIQDLNYIVAIGMDYDEKKGEYITYLQSLNFAEVAKQEGGRPTGPIPAFVAKAKGKTLNLAVSHLYKKSEPPLFFGHVITFVISNHLVDHKFREVVEEIERNKSLRHTMRIVIAEDPIQDVFQAKALFDYPAPYTVMFRKGGNRAYLDSLKPMLALQFLREYFEPMGVAKIPMVKIDHNTWKAEKKYPVLFFNGWAVFQNRKHIANLPFKDSLYMEWLTEKKISVEEEVNEHEKLLAAVKLDSPKMKVKYMKGTASPVFSVELSVKGDLLEKIEDVSITKLNRIIAADTKKKVAALYKKGIQQQADLLNVGKKWYRRHPKSFHELEKSGTFYLDESSLKSIKVKAEISHFNTYKYYKREE